MVRKGWKMMECHDCSKNLYWKHDPDWENKYDSAYFSPGVLDKYVRCLRCWKLEMDEKKIPYEDEETKQGGVMSHEGNDQIIEGIRDKILEDNRDELAKRINVAWLSFIQRVKSMDYYRKQHIDEDEMPGKFMIDMANIFISTHYQTMSEVFGDFPEEVEDENQGS